MKSTKDVKKNYKNLLEIPGSITCFFTPEIGKSFRESGSYGVGIAIKNGVKITENCKEKTSKILKKIPSVVYAVKKLKDYGINFDLQNLNVKINFPVGCGFGMSSSLSFSAIISACEFNRTYLPLRVIADIVHEAEVVNNTGLGDVVCQLHGGVVCRLGAGLPSIVPVRKFFWNVSFDVLILDALETKEALKEFDFSSGKKRLKEFLKQPTLENLFKQSKMFAYETGIAESVGVDDIIEAVESVEGMASMIMLGKAVFALNANTVLKEFGNPIKVKVDVSGLIEKI